MNFTMLIIFIIAFTYPLLFRLMRKNIFKTIIIILIFTMLVLICRVKENDNFIPIRHNEETLGDNYDLIG